MVPLAFSFVCLFCFFTVGAAEGRLGENLHLD